MLHLLSIPNPFGGQVWHIAHTTSTMDETAQLCEAHPGQDLSGSLVLTDYQSRGRGRFAERSWQAAVGESLLFTILVKPVTSFPLSLSLALGICHFLEANGLSAQVKWPNDVLLEGHKVCGILVSGTQRLMHCGIGLNLRTPDFQPLPGKRQATSLAAHGISLEPGMALEQLLPFLHTAVAESPHQQHAALEQRLWQRDQWTEMVSGGSDGSLIQGWVRGLAPDGALLLENDQGIQKMYSGE